MTLLYRYDTKNKKSSLRDTNRLRARSLYATREGQSISEEIYGKYQKEDVAEQVKAYMNDPQRREMMNMDKNEKWEPKKEEGEDNGGIR